MCGYSVPNYPEQAIQEKLYVISLACPRQKDARRGHPASAGKPISVFQGFFFGFYACWQHRSLPGWKG